MKKLHDMNINEFFAKLPAWTIEQETGYKPCTTFWQDFSIADVFVLNGMEPDAVQDTHNRSWPMVKEMALGIKGLTEYVMVLNWKCWEHHGKDNGKLCKLYQDLYYETHHWALDNLKGEELEYYLDTTD